MYGGYGFGGYDGYGGYGTGAGYYGGWNIRWVYALLVLIVIVLQFGRNKKDRALITGPCDDVSIAAGSGKGFDEGLIDNSVLFIIVVFLLILCAGCWTGGYSNYGAAGGFGFGY